jgi:hypothetical protein
MLFEFTPPASLTRYALYISPAGHAIHTSVCRSCGWCLSRAHIWSSPLPLPFFQNRFCYCNVWNILQILPSEPLTVVEEKRYFGKSWCRLESLLPSSQNSLYRCFFTCYTSSATWLQSRTSMSQPRLTELTVVVLPGLNGRARSKTVVSELEVLVWSDKQFSGWDKPFGQRYLIVWLSWWRWVCFPQKSTYDGICMRMRDRRAWGAESRMPRGKEVAR